MNEGSIGGLRIIRMLGKGGMSEVYECEDPQLGSRHAVKVYSYPKEDAEVRSRFETEGKLLAKLNHPRIVKVTDLGIDEKSGKPYFVMDLVLDEHGDTHSLGDIGAGEVDEEMVGRWYDDIREGLEYIHGKGVIHRDLKLQNVLIGPDGHAVLTDFGVSKVFAVEGQDRPVVDTVQTLVKVREGRSLVMGSLGYMAPELEMGVAASKQSDWYALGVIVYKLLTGTWCDARTDVVGNLETYDPVWTVIVPRLLHSNPLARECLSYAEQKRLAREHADFEAEERWLKAKERAHNARHAARYIGAGAMLFASVLGYMYYHYEGRLRAAAAREEKLVATLALPAFSDVMRLPPKSGAPEGDVWADNRRNNSLTDVWVLSHAIFDDLKSGRVTLEKAAESVEKLADRAAGDPLGLFDMNSGQTITGDAALIERILRDGASAMRRRLK